MAPLLVFLRVFFLLPSFSMYRQSVQNLEGVHGLPWTMAVLEEWDGTGLPDESVIATMVEDDRVSYKAKCIPKVAVRLNYESPLYRSMVLLSLLVLTAIEILSKRAERSQGGRAAAP